MKQKIPQLFYKNYSNPFNNVALLSMDWHHTLEKYLWMILSQKPICFGDFEKNSIPQTQGVYLITDIRNPMNERVMYVGDSGNLRNRIYIHFMGKVANSPSIRYLVHDSAESGITNYHEARKFIVNNFAYRFIECKEDWEDPTKICGYIEAYLIAKLKPLYGIYKEK